MSKKDPNCLTSGMTMAVDFLSQFHKRIVANDGSTLLIHHMTLPASAEKLDELAKFAVSQHFPVPRSELESRARKQASEEWDNPEVHEEVSRFFWDILDLEREYGIPTKRFGRKYFEGAERDGPIPNEVIKQLSSKIVKYPLILHFVDEPHVVVAINAGTKVGDELRSFGDEDDYVHLAPAKYFDLEH